MPIRIFLICLLMQLSSFIIFAQQDEVSVLLNDKIMGKKIIEDDSSKNIITLYKQDFENDSIIFFNIKQKATNRVYKKNIELTDSNGHQIALLYELIKRPGVYMDSFNDGLKQIFKQQIIKIFLLENPVNDMMSIPSRRKFLVELHFK